MHHVKINELARNIVERIINNKEIYKRNFSEILRDAVRNNKEKIKKLGLNGSEIFKRTWPLVLNESQIRAFNLQEFILKHNIFGKELW